MSEPNKGENVLAQMSTELIVTDDGIGQVHTVTFTEMGLASAISALKRDGTLNLGWIVLKLNPAEATE